MIGKFLNHREDSLTACVFTHLFHLPIEVAWQLLTTACETNGLPTVSGEIESIHYWPKWNSEFTVNSNYVEPDLLVCFPDFDLIVESKRWDGYMQSPNQWRSQLIAYATEWPELKKPVHYLALGGLHSRTESTPWTEENPPPEIAAPLRDLNVQKCYWIGILEQAKLFRDSESAHRFPSSQTRATVRILDDLIELFAWHGFSTGKWYQDFNFPTLNLSNRLDRHQETLRDLSNIYSLRPS